MLTAFGLSALFLVGYLVHHAQVGSVPFAGTGVVRTFYFALLVPHIALSAVVLPLALTTIWHGWHGNVPAHRRIARWTLPLWLYVSVSGVAVYWMLYRL
jgi:putative membrane protein